ncbi:dephospho-CoA kinase [Alkalicoccobacillus plakortidis]|uniref:Dephospho-CoA kinase n=1 Tax=Alkalicoccobacillus plakortidis TaxID=444060 RepID=A0ABT0XHL4_9BACI|nr:dephospho-CoA kinase [Alkalicoccobacillus plakortidis]MCM2675255.1 dephospho-CoA kinase [Alkalicoccobacillus plakortidis]
MIIGLTGGIATGKSTVANMIKQAGVPVVDADVIAKEVMQVGGAAFDQVVSTFGEDILQEDGSINRSLLGDRIFSDEGQRKKLNAIVHPVVREQLLSKAKAYQQEGHKHVVLDIPLLYESNLFHLVDKVLLVYVQPDIQLERLVTRDKNGVEQARSRMNAQIAIDEKVERADEIIRNHGSKEETERQLHHIFKNWNVRQ